jgi:hypothetical protein
MTGEREKRGQAPFGEQDVTDRNWLQAASRKSIAGGSMSRVLWRRALVVTSCVWLVGAAPAPSAGPEPGLLFYLSGEHGLTADYAAGGDPRPNFAHDVRVIAGGAKGQGLECGHAQLLSYWAPGNMYAQRGTLSFFWRSRDPVGPTPFPVFRVGYGDHSSWDMVWLRIDYNGRGFDAFVTDASLARTRVSHPMPSFPAPDRWVHLALSWDENRGIRFYVDGKLAAKQDGVAIFDAALDQFGPHSRIISPYQVQSAYNFVRGGDLDELRVYDRMLTDDNVATLARGEVPVTIPPLARSLDQPEWRDEWWFRNGWNRPGDVPPSLDAPVVGIRKVEIHSAWDIKRWWWKGTDGIRETTWPGVYNRSRLPGRNDYFQLPDWDCYSTSGTSVTFNMADEPWNHVEIAGAAWGSARLAATVGSAMSGGVALFERPKGQERTFHRLPTPVRGRSVTFTNVEPETPIGEFGAYYVAPATEPAGIGRLTYRLTALAEPNQPSVATALAFINGRHAADERATMVALPSLLPLIPRTPRTAATAGLPIVHILIPSDFRDANPGPGRGDSVFSWMNLPGGLDGIAIDLPALTVTPTHGAFVPLRIQVKDPIWPLRNMLDVSVSVKPGEARTIWLDTRDRILPADKGLYLSISAAGTGFGPSSLEGAELRLVIKSRTDALAEHTLDRFTQIRDNYAHLVEESPRTRRLNLFTRWETDITDLLRADPEHVLGRQYWYDYNKEQPAPPVTMAPVPAGVPAWAFRQTELLRAIKRFVNWYIDRRQIENGEFGGGLSDDGDLTNSWPGLAFMGGNPDKVARSLSRHMEAFYEQGMFTNGLSTIQTDELHSYEEGIQVLGQVMLLDFGNPKQIERAMETAAALERITGINNAGHRHFRSSYFSGSKVAEEGVWGWQKMNSLLALHPAIALVDYNGAPRVRKWLLELADGLLAHYIADASGARTLRTTIEFSTDRDLPSPSDRAWPLLWAAYRWTGDGKYAQPMIDTGPRALAGLNTNALDRLGLRDTWRTQILAPGGQPPRTDGARHLAWQVSGDVDILAALYRDQVRAAALREYINTDGSLWIDRVTVPMTEVQRARLGGVALVRNLFVPGHAVSWQFAGTDDEKVGVLIPDATPRHLTVTGYNLDPSAVAATMTLWDIDPGQWEVTTGTRAEPGSGPLSNVVTRMVELDRSSTFPVTFAPRVSTVVELRHVSNGAPYWDRPDLAIGPDDVRVSGRGMSVTVHSVGAVLARASRLVVRDGAGREVASARVPGMEAPTDLRPRTVAVKVTLPGPGNRTGWSVSIEMPAGAREITLVNNRVGL